MLAATSDQVSVAAGARSVPGAAGAWCREQASSHEPPAPALERARPRRRAMRRRVRAFTMSSIRESDGESIGGRRTGSRVHEGVGSEPKLESERSGTTAEPIACTHTECERGQAATGNQPVVAVWRFEG